MIEISGKFVGKDYLVQYRETLNGQTVSDEVTAFTVDFDVDNSDLYEKSFLLVDVESTHYYKIYDNFRKNSTLFNHIDLFFALRCYDASRTKEARFPFDEDWLGIGKHHNEILGCEEIDSENSLEKALNPWWSQFGFENYAVLKSCFGSGRYYVQSPRDLRVFRDDPEKLKLFKRFMVAKYMLDKDIGPKGINTKFSEIEEVLDFDFIPQPHLSLGYFVTLPFHDDYILKKVEEMTVGEIRFMGPTPKNSTTEVMREIFENDLAEAKFHNNASKIREANRLYNKLFELMNDDMIKDIENLHYVYEHVTTYYSKSGFRRVMAGIADAGLPYFKNVDHFLDVSELISNSDKSVKWVVDGEDYDNFVVTKLQEKLGSFVTIDVIQKVYESDGVLTYEQWLSLADSYEKVKDCPVSWWTSIL